MRISDWSSDVCSSDLSLTRALSVSRLRSTRTEKEISSISAPPPKPRRRPVPPRPSSARRAAARRSEERRVGKECVVRVDTGGCPNIKKNNNHKQLQQQHHDQSENNQQETISRH